MDSLDTSFIVVGRGKIIRTLFDRPISVKGKSIRLKSVAFPEPENQPIRYKFAVRDIDNFNVYQLTLPPEVWYRSEHLLRAMYIAICDLYESLGDRHTFSIDENDNVEIIPITREKPRFMASQTLSHPPTAIYYEKSGLQIVEDDDLTHPQSVHFLLDQTERRSNKERFAYLPHITLDHATPDPIDYGLSKTQPLFLFCDAIQPVFCGGHKRRILDIVELSRDGNYFSNPTGEFHSFAVDILMQISIYFQTVDGNLISFKDPVVIHFLIK